ncbi:hypothetical protein EV363DRAFT_1152947 [Boletus edulis]|nr:hypothetical protein EV363DRAFT_1152947 [Boletus edulis]
MFSLTNLCINKIFIYWDSESVIARGGTLKSTYVPSSVPTHADSVAWKIIRDFATLPNTTRPDTEVRLQAHLGERYKAEDWEPVLKAITDEEDTETALATVDKLEKAALQRTGLKIRLPARPCQPDQLITAESTLMESVNELKSKNRIFGSPPTVDELLDPTEEREMEEPRFDENDLEKSIADEVRREIAGENVAEAESDDECEPVGPTVTRGELIQLCEQLESGCMEYGDPQLSLDLLGRIRTYRATLRREELVNAKQTSLDRFFKA